MAISLSISAAIEPTPNRCVRALVEPLEADPAAAPATAAEIEAVLLAHRAAPGALRLS